MIDPDWTRREVLATAVVTGGSMMMVGSSAAAAVSGVGLVEHQTIDLALTINGVEHRASGVEVHTTLLDLLRDRLGLTGTKKGCGLGQCGACTVHVDGRRVNSCLTLAVMQQGKAITTIEGLAAKDGLHPLQAAFIEHDGFQCGYCTSGQIMSGVACITEGHTGSDDDIREWMSGNLCRCGAYPNIVAAIRQTATGKP